MIAFDMFQSAGFDERSQVFQIGLVPNQCTEQAHPLSRRKSHPRCAYGSGSCNCQTGPWTFPAPPAIFIFPPQISRSFRPQTASFCMDGIHLTLPTPPSAVQASPLPFKSVSNGMWFSFLFKQCSHWPVRKPHQSRRCQHHARLNFFTDYSWPSINDLTTGQLNYLRR